MMHFLNSMLQQPKMAYLLNSMLTVDDVLLNSMVSSEFIAAACRYLLHSLLHQTQMTYLLYSCTSSHSCTF
jgi:hypothetical protein